MRALIAIVICSACAEPAPVLSDAEMQALQALRYDDAPPPSDPSNRVDEMEAARLFGRRLFFDPSFSGPLIDADNDGRPSTLGRRGEPGRVSCAGCHLPESDFQDTRSLNQQISLAAMWTKRRTPTLFEVGFEPLYNWDGRRDSLWGQAIGVMESEREFNGGRLFVAEQVARLHRAEYESIFGEMPAIDHLPQLAPSEAGCVQRIVGTEVLFDCRGRPGDGADYDMLSADDQQRVTEITVNTAKAISSYVRLLRCGESAFDAWLDGDQNALSASEIRGAALFVGRARCVQCHSGPNLSDGRFHNVGLRPQPVAVAFIDSNDRGAGEAVPALLTDPLNTLGMFSDGDRGVLPVATGPELEGAFRTPTLRCAADRPSYMHTAHLRTLDSVVRFFDRGGDPSGYPGTSEIEPIGLTEQERADLVAFLSALTGPGPDPSLLAAP